MRSAGLRWTDVVLARIAEIEAAVAAVLIETVLLTQRQTVVQAVVVIQLLQLAQLVKVTTAALLPQATQHAAKVAAAVLVRLEMTAIPVRLSAVMAARVLLLQSLEVQ